jgi:small subunit ribosomal protein S5e
MSTEQVTGSEIEPKLFSRWSYKEINISDPCFIDYVAIHTNKSMVFTPHTAGRYQQKTFRKATCPIVERLVGSLQFAGRNTGKKAKAIRIVRHTFEIIHLLTGENPVEVFIKAVMNSGPREDSTKIGSGSGRKQAVDVSPLRRVNLGIYLICNGILYYLLRSQITHIQSY